MYELINFIYRYTLFRKERIDYFLIHMNLILALLLQCLTYFIDYYGALSEDTNKQVTSLIVTSQFPGHFVEIH